MGCSQLATKSIYAQACSDAVRARIWIIGLGPLALLLGNRLTSLTRSLRVGNERFMAATGWCPRFPSVREGYLAMAETPVSKD